MMRYFLDFIFPKKSLEGREGQWMTPEERRALKSCPRILEEAALRKLGLSWIDRVVAASGLRDTPGLRTAIHLLKYKRVPELAEDLFGLLLGMKDFIPKDAVITPVPLHWTRRFWRGFNQAELLAEQLSRETQIPCRNLLKRIRPTGHQTGRNKEDRIVAVNNAFRYIAEGSVPETVILIDDVFTTGATLNMCAKALKKAGVDRVEALVLAHD